jgi:hypothetical protein
VDVGTAVGADEEAATVVQPGEGAFDDPAVTSESGAVFGLAAGDDQPQRDRRCAKAERPRREKPNAGGEGRR